MDLTVIEDKKNLDKLLKLNIDDFYDMWPGIMETYYVPSLSKRFKLDWLIRTGELQGDIANEETIDAMFFDLYEEILQYKPDKKVEDEVLLLKQFYSWLITKFTPNRYERLLAYYNNVLDCYYEIANKYYVNLPYRQALFKFKNDKFSESMKDKKLIHLFSYLKKPTGRQIQFSLNGLKKRCEELKDVLKEFITLENDFIETYTYRFKQLPNEILGEKDSIEKINEDMIKFKTISDFNDYQYYKFMYFLKQPVISLYEYTIPEIRKEIFKTIEKKFKIKTSHLSLGRESQTQAIYVNKWYMVFDENLDKRDVYKLVHSIVRYETDIFDYEDDILPLLEGLFNSFWEIPFIEESLDLVNKFKKIIDNMKSTDIETLINLQRGLDQFKKRMPKRAYIGSWQLMDIGFYLALMKKYKNTCLLVENNENKDIENQLSIVINDEGKIINIPYGEIEFIQRLKECGRNGKMVLIPLTYRGAGWGHANMLIYNPFLETIEHYEPHGARFRSYKVIVNFQEKVRISLEDLFVNIKYMPPHSVCPKYSLQHYEVNRGGQCLIWAWYITHLRLQNPSTNPRELLNKAIQVALTKTSSLEDIVINFHNNIREILKKMKKVIADDLKINKKDLKTKDFANGMYKLISEFQEAPQFKVKLYITTKNILRDKVIKVAEALGKLGLLDLGLLKAIINEPVREEMKKIFRSYITENNVSNKEKIKGSLGVYKRFYDVVAEINKIKTENFKENTTNVNLINVDVSNVKYKIKQTNIGGNAATKASIVKIQNTKFK